MPQGEDVSTTRPRGPGRRGDPTRPRPVTPRDVMQYHDGETDPLVAGQIEQRLVWDPRQRAYLRSLETIGDGVRDAVRQATPSFDLTDRIMARVAAEAVGAAEPARGEARRHVAPTASWHRKITVALGVGLGSTAALAAGALFWLSVGMPLDSQPEVTVSAQALDRPSADADAALGAAIESVDFGTGGGSIFMVQAGQTPTPVVWLSEPPEVEVGSEPL